MTFLNDILEWIVSMIDYTINVDKTVDNGDGTYTLFTCDTFILRTGKKVEIQGSKYTITDFKINKSITIKAKNLPKIKNFKCYQIGYQSGTLLDADKERGSKRNLHKNAVPFIWNRHPYTAELNWNEVSNKGTEFDVEWYLLDVTNPKDYLVKDDEMEVIQPMYNGLERIKDLINNGNVIKDITGTITTTPYKELGVVDKSGNKERLFEENLSGIKIEFSFETYKDCRC